METANIQSVVENNIVSVALMNIQPSNYNRKHSINSPFHSKNVILLL